MELSHLCDLHITNMCTRVDLRFKISLLWVTNHQARLSLESVFLVNFVMICTGHIFALLLLTLTSIMVVTCAVLESFMGSLMVHGYCFLYCSPVY